MFKPWDIVCMHALRACAQHPIPTWSAHKFLIFDTFRSGLFITAVSHMRILLSLCPAGRLRNGANPIPFCKYREVTFMDPDEGSVETCFLYHAFPVSLSQRRADPCVVEVAQGSIMQGMKWSRSMRKKIKDAYKKAYTNTG